MALLLASALLIGSLGSDVQELADENGLDAGDLQAAADTVGATPYDYLVSEGVIKPAIPPAVERRLDCIAWYESKDTPGATNPISKAAGLFQFLWSTWRGTPQGKAGMSPYDPIAARSAARWMLNQGRAREWVAVQRGLC